MVCVHAFIAANGFVQYGDAVCGPVRQWLYGSTVVRCAVQCGSGRMDRSQPVCGVAMPTEARRRKGRDR